MAAIETAFMAVAFGEQVAQGTILAATRDLAGALDLTNGIVLGDKESGQMESGISISFVREGRDRPVVGGSQTWQQDEFLRQQVGTFSVAFPFSGNRKTTTTPLDAEFQQDPGIEAILKACGLTSAADGSGVGWEYLPGLPVVFHYVAAGEDAGYVGVHVGPVDDNVVPVVLDPRLVHQ